MSHKECALNEAEPPHHHPPSPGHSRNPPPVTGLSRSRVSTGHYKLLPGRVVGNATRQRISVPGAGRSAAGKARWEREKLLFYREKSTPLTSFQTAVQAAAAIIPFCSLNKRNEMDFSFTELFAESCAESDSLATPVCQEHRGRKELSVVCVSLFCVVFFAVADRT